MIARMARSVLVVDDDAAFRKLAARMLIAAGLVVVGEAATAADASVAAAALRPDAALVDVMLADGDGIALATELTALPWGLRVLLTSSDPFAAGTSELARSRAQAFVPKSELPRAPLRRLLFGD
jgi:DNA-binding NarL/FixJ family response regulator